MARSRRIDRVDVVALVIVKNERVLLERRKKDRKVDPGKIAIPGGHVENGESLEQACKRELEEELGLECNDFRYVVSIPHDSTSEKQIVHYYSCENWKGVPKSREAESTFWISIKNLKCLDFEIDRTAIQISIEQKKQTDKV
jgi:mutator protein MutT